MNSKFFKSTFYLCLTLFIGVLAFYIVYNSQWLVGDDAIIIRHTGWGHFFNPKDTVIPESGRFFPMAYFLYNILPVLHMYSVEAHFTLHLCVFLIFSFFSYKVVSSSIETHHGIWSYIIVFAGLAICIQRGYNAFLDGFSTIWIDYTLVMIWAYCSFKVHTQQSKMAACIGFCVVTYLSYCIEANFILPLCYGLLSIILLRKQNTKLENVYFLSMIFTALVFLIVYYFTCFLYIKSAYDGSHGSNVTLFDNAINMLVAQKIMLLGLLVLLWRSYQILHAHTPIDQYDVMLLTGFGFCCGCIILKLNWVMYYSIGTLIMMPSIIHCLCNIQYRWIAPAVLICLSIFMCRTLPKYIAGNQLSRKRTTVQMNIISQQYNYGQKFYWYEPIDNREWCFDLEFRAWLREALQSQIGWQNENEQFKLNVITEFSDSITYSGVYFVSEQNEKLFPGINEKIINAGEVLHNDKERNIQTILIK